MSTLKTTVLLFGFSVLTSFFSCIANIIFIIKTILFCCLCHSAISEYSDIVFTFLPKIDNF